jgi:hypothetical protein
VDAIRAYARKTPDVILAAELTGWADRIDGLSEPRVADISYRIAIWTGVLAREVHDGTMTIETALQRIAGHALTLNPGRDSYVPSERERLRADALDAAKAENARLRAGIDAVRRANDPKESCLAECASWNDYDDCDCGYIEAADDLCGHLLALLES